VLLWKGRSLLESEIFSARWALAVQWVEHYCILDPRLLGGLEIEMAKWNPLSKLRPDGIWEIQPDEMASRRLLWISREETVETPVSALPNPVQVPKIEVVDTRAIATRESGPEQWALTSADGTSLGRALIRTMAVSELLRSVKKQSVRVEVEWNGAFTKWEIRGLAA